MDGRVHGEVKEVLFLDSRFGPEPSAYLGVSWGLLGILHSLPRHEVRADKTCTGRVQT